MVIYDIDRSVGGANRICDKPSAMDRLDFARWQHVDCHYPYANDENRYLEWGHSLRDLHKFGCSDQISG